VPTKPSPTDPEKRIPALAKTDAGMTFLCEHENPHVAMAANARLGQKSTILESRILRFLEVANATGGKLPVPINYWGADTGRDSGAFKLNLQNMSRVVPGSPRPSDALRRSVTAPPGHCIVTADLSGIEMRVNMFLWKVPYATRLLTEDPEHADLYRALAADVFHVPVEQVTKQQRQASKAQHLACGYGMGSAEKFVTAAKTMAGIDVSPDEAIDHIDSYRRRHPELSSRVDGAWRRCDRAIESMYSGDETAIDDWGLVVTAKDSLRTPRGGLLRYPLLRSEPDGRWRKWMYGGDGRKAKTLYGAKLCENIVQHIARQIIMDDALVIEREFGLRPSLRVHDELVYVVPATEAEETLQNVLTIMRRPPAWWPQLAVWAEGGIGTNYAEAK
jgi:DNA polymerase